LLDQQLVAQIRDLASELPFVFQSLYFQDKIVLFRIFRTWHLVSLTLFDTWNEILFSSLDLVLVLEKMPKKVLK